MTLNFYFRYLSSLIIMVMIIVAAGKAQDDSLNSNSDLPFSISADPNTTAFYLSEEELDDFDMEEFSDWLLHMPGYYPIDRGGFAQPSRGIFMGLLPFNLTVKYRGRELQDPLLGSPELNWISPGSISSLRFDPFSISSPGAAIEAGLRTLGNDPPASRVATRDGYYRLGFVDFDLAEKVTPSILLNGGGRVSTYDGRLEHSAGYGLNLRAEVIWMDTSRVNQDSGGLWGWWGIMQNRRKAEVPYSNVNHNTERYEIDFEIHWNKFTVRSFGIQQRETYGGGGADSWDELGVIVSMDNEGESFAYNANINGSTARWRLKNTSWQSTSFGGFDFEAKVQPVEKFTITADTEIGLSDDFGIKRGIGLKCNVKLNESILLFIGGSQHQRWPTRFESSADFSPNEHFLVYDPIFFQNPQLSIVGNHDLNNETINTVFTGFRLESRRFQGEFGYLGYHANDRIAWQVQNDDIMPFNAVKEDAGGVSGWCRLQPSNRFEMGSTGSYLPLASGKRRLFPEAMAHSWVQYQQILFNEHLDMRFRIWENYWGQRWFPVPGGWKKVDDAFILSGRISARIYGFYIYWGVNNILSLDYELLPGYEAMHKEEVWGLSWNFID